MKAVIVYSGKGGVGKTTTTANIARVLARQGKKTFIIDADINTPSMCTEFKGEITLFADEVMPADMKIIKQSLEDGYILRSDGRYIPPKPVMEQCYHTFGHRIGLCDNLEKYYDEWKIS